MKSVLRVAIVVVSVVVLVMGCSSPMRSSGDIAVVKERQESKLMSIPGVVGVGIGECEAKPCLKVFVTQQTVELERQIPQQVEGYKVDIEATGPIEAQPR